MNSVAAAGYQNRILGSIEASKNPRIKNLSRPEFLLKRCTHLIQLKQIHALIIRTPSNQTSHLLAKLVESLAGSAQMDYACLVFEQMVEPTVFVFNTMVRGYATIDADKNKGIELYIQMRHLGLEPDKFTYPFLLKACTALHQGKGVHSLVLKTQGFDSDIYAQTSLLSFYSSHGHLECAGLVFDRMLERNVVSWTAMITGYVKQHKYRDALALFHRMQIAGIEINELTLVNVLCACAHLGALEMGKWVHSYIQRNQVFLNPTLATALLDMYTKCGYLNTASQVFENLPHKSVCTWNAIIGGLALHGLGEEAIDRFKQMQRSGTTPDSITFIGVLCACSHSGLVNKGREFFYSMKKDYGIEPNIKHYGCLIDLLGRAGYLDEVYGILLDMPTEANGVLWGTLLNACAQHSNVKLAETAMEHLVELEPFNDGNYVLMSRIYAAKSQWDDAATVRKLMKDKCILKTPGCSSIEIDNSVHEFITGDSRHPRSQEIYGMLDNVTLRLKENGCVPKNVNILFN